MTDQHDAPAHPRVGGSPDPNRVTRRGAEPFASAAEAEAVVGDALYDRRLNGRDIDLAGIDLPALVARLLATTRDFERRMRNAEREAVLDPLTGLGNRRQWRTALRKAEERCRRGEGDAVVAVVDLDDFKQINDERGHTAGDEILRRLSETLLSVVRAGDTVARTGGDEFAVLAFSTDDSDTLGSRLRKAIREAGLAASVGTASRRGAGSLEQAWQRADESMYSAKARARRRGRPLQVARREGQAPEPTS